MNDQRVDTEVDSARGMPSEFYELTSLACPMLGTSEVAKAARDWVAEPDASGTLLGCWRTEFSTLGRLLILRSFDTLDALHQERRRALLSTNPFNAKRLITALEMASYQGFSFLPPARPGAYGDVYEFRTYKLKPGGLPPTLAGWEAAIAPAREYTARLVINMYALDGLPRITHIWGFESRAQRASLRSNAFAAGVWPPKGGPENVMEAVSVIAVPEGE
jgi:NIPSNAP